MRRSTLAFFLLSLGLTIADASAQDDPRKAQAAPFFEEGRKLAEQGRNAESLEKFRKAYDTYPSPNTQFNIARQEQLLGQRLAAIRDYREALKNPVLLPQLVTAAKAAVTELEQSLARVKIVGPDGARVTVADREYTLPRQEPVDVEPGMTEVKGSVGSEKLSAYVEAHAGTMTLVELKSKGSTGVDEPPPPVESTRWGTGQYAGAALFAAGAVSIGAGIGFAVARGGSDEDIDRLAPFTGPNGELCAGNPSLRQCSDLADKQGERDRNGALSTSFLVGGAVFMVAGVVTFFVAPKRSNTSAGISMRPWADARTRGFELRF